MPLMTKKDYAARGIAQTDGTFRAVSKAYLSKRETKERLKDAMVKTDKGELIDSEKADAIFQSTRDPARYMAAASANKPTQAESPASSSAAPAPGSYESERSRSMRVRAEMDELELSMKKKELVSVSAVSAAIIAAGSTIREHLQSRNTRISELAATMSNPREIKKALDDDDRTMFSLINNDFSQRISDILGDSPSAATN